METRKISLLAICFASVVIQDSSHVAAIKIKIGRTLGLAQGTLAKPNHLSPHTLSIRKT